ncbi:MAG: hypothetical protein JST53_07925 [Actinobacteria bacterium]|nr:hypothetical protein [Actinomycetota bacterium]
MAGDDVRMKLYGTFRLAALLLVVACFAVIVGARTSEARSAEPQCSVGGPPSIEGGPDLLEKPLSPELVIACGKSVVGPFEIVAYTGVNHLLCTLFLGSAFGGGECGASLHESRLARDGLLVTDIRWAWGGGPGRSYTAMTGWVRPDVARIEVRYHRKNEKAISHVDATLGQVNGELLSSLDQPTPFGRFAVVLPGCSVPQGLRVLAFDSEEQMIGSERGRRESGFGQPCRH